MKLKHCDEEMQLKLRKPSVKRMHRPHKSDIYMRGRAKLAAFFNIKTMAF